MRERRRRVAWTVCLFVLALATGGSEFNGCSGSGASEAEDGVELPEASGDGCLIDGDCAGMDECVQLACIGGRCVEVGPATDADGDGFAPAPCGGDCDDADASIFPEAMEVCDGVDQDCDGTVDEDATGAQNATHLDGLRDSTVVGLSDGFAALGLSADDEMVTQLRAYRIDSTGGDVVAQPVSDSFRPLVFAAAALPSGTIVVVGLVEGGLQRAEIAFDGDTPRLVAGPEPLGGVGAPALDGLRFELLVSAGQEWVAFDTPASEEPGHRFLWRSGGEGAVDLGPWQVGEAPPALASDGTHVAVSAGASTVIFFDAAGSEAGRQQLPGPFAHGPLASGEGFVYAAYKDAFDHNLTRLTVESSTAPVAAPAGAREDEVSLFFTPPHVLVVRTRELEARAWLLDADLRRYAATIEPGELSRLSGSPEALSAATSGEALSGLMIDYGVQGASFTTFGCD